MKIGTLVKLGLIGGGIYYVKKQGGLKAAWNKLSNKIDQLADQVKSQSQRSMYESESGFVGKSDVPETGASPTAGMSGTVGSSEKTGY